eukprot:scaffold3058_cov177-Amphora_coffeaeformis.AAC.3
MLVKQPPKETRWRKDSNLTPLFIFGRMLAYSVDKIVPRSSLCGDGGVLRGELPPRYNRLPTRAIPVLLPRDATDPEDDVDSELTRIDPKEVHLHYGSPIQVRWDSHLSTGGANPGQQDTCRRASVLGFPITSVAPPSVKDEETSGASSMCSSAKDSEREALLVITFFPRLSAKEGCWLTHRLERLSFLSIGMVL